MPENSKQELTQILEFCRYLITKDGKGVNCMSIASDLIRGHTDTIILAHLMEKDSYGYEINKHISKLSDGMYELKEATLYTAFKRLEDAGVIASYWGDELRGARRKYYRITEAGKEMYIRLLEEWNSAKRIIDKLVQCTSYKE